MNKILNFICLFLFFVTIYEVVSGNKNLAILAVVTSVLLLILGVSLDIKADRKPRFFGR
jgi:hypothetical protein